MNEGRIIAFGDIHGCSIALTTLIEAIQPTPLDTLVFLGDYIDRGPDSRGVIEQVIRLGERCQVVPLLGNHEEMLLGGLEGKDNLRFWLKLGGKETLDSYGAGDDVKKIPQHHIQFIKGCHNYYETVSHIFVHAFYDPDRPLHEQSWDGLRWASLPPDPKRALLGQGRHRRPHGAEERRDTRPGLREVHRHLLPRWRLVDGAGGRDGAGVAGESGRKTARSEGAFNTLMFSCRMGCSSCRFSTAGLHCSSAASSGGWFFRARRISVLQMYQLR